MTRKLRHSCQTIVLSEQRRNINKFRASFDSVLSSNILCISEESSLHKELRPSQIVESETNIKKVIDAICSFTNTFNTERCAEEFYCLSSGLPAKPDVAADLLNACKIGKASMEKFIQDRMVNHNAFFHNPIKRNKLKTFAKAEVKKTLKITQNRMTQIKPERNIFGQLVLLSVQNDIDLQVTLSYPLGPVPWALATADGMSIKLTRQSSYTTFNPQWKHYCFIQKKMLFYCR